MPHLRDASTPTSGQVGPSRTARDRKQPSTKVRGMAFQSIRRKERRPFAKAIDVRMVVLLLGIQISGAVFLALLITRVS
jgi:hypothetical protein